VSVLRLRLGCGVLHLGPRFEQEGFAALRRFAFKVRRFRSVRIEDIFGFRALESEREPFRPVRRIRLLRLGARPRRRRALALGLPG